MLDLCLACKGCKSECPSNVDVAKMKMEFLQHYYDANGVSMRTWMIANFRMLTSLAAIAPGIYNWLVKGDLSSRLIKAFLRLRRRPLYAHAGTENAAQAGCETKPAEP